MKVYVNSVLGVPDAIITMYMSKRTWTRELEEHIRYVCNHVLDTDGRLMPGYACKGISGPIFQEFNDYVNRLVSWGWRHITMLRYIEISCTVEGLHRGGQDDWDAHAMRYNNRIIRSSTRLATFGNELSDFYKDKVIPTDNALKMLNIEIPDTIEHDGKKYVKTVNGYIREDLKDDKDVKRGLYMLGIPSNFIFKVNLTEFAHVYKERNIDSSANPEVKQVAESIADQLEDFIPQFNRELLLKIKN